MHLQSYTVKESHGWVYLWWGQPREDLPPMPYFDGVDDSFSYRTIQDHWATHYSRAIENQLDVVHLPFIHKTTIGRGNRTLVNGPLTRAYASPDCSGDRLDLWVYNSVDTGQKPLKPAEIPTPERHPFLQFIFPNLWQNWISDDLRIVVAFVPIDDENTMMYLRGYQKMVKLPVLRELMNWINSLANLVIERQDRRVVIFQEPKASDLRMGEKLIQGDGPIIEYRRRRKTLQEAAQRTGEDAIHA
jgi:phenylpropionate dioxygenase-like ring-hydroxylating dioxygenase large terminal subunit